MSTSITELKSELRKKIKALPPPEWLPLLRDFLDLPQVKRAERIMLFCGVGDEPDTRGLIVTLLAAHKTVALPHCLSNARMEARAVRNFSDLTEQQFGIPAPGRACPVIERDQLDVILVPHLCCDKAGYRLGHGSGYYDRYLAGYPGLTVALCPSDRLMESLPHEPFDVPVKLVLSD